MALKLSPLSAEIFWLSAYKLIKSVTILQEGPTTVIKLKKANYQNKQIMYINHWLFVNERLWWNDPELNAVYNH